MIELFNVVHESLLAASLATTACDKIMASQLSMTPGDLKNCVPLRYVPFQPTSTSSQPTNIFLTFWENIILAIEFYSFKCFQPESEPKSMRCRSLDVPRTGGFKGYLRNKATHLKTDKKNQTCEDLEMFWSGGRRCDVYPLELTATAAVGAAGDVNTGIA
ncbi:hypothetical protein RRG08_032005 [Elysia crispata]|uniref:Uncharacterized protein n=1 Tax=Elysia crispata TaxID=231223 RepID=A0AAE1A3I9_9GAST|nr:hypothetical protein RRG08_032005 [Elysia crispata]